MASSSDRWNIARINGCTETPSYNNRDASGNRQMAIRTWHHRATPIYPSNRAPAGQSTSRTRAERFDPSNRMASLRGGRPSTASTAGNPTSRATLLHQRKRHKPDPVRDSLASGSKGGMSNPLPTVKKPFFLAPESKDIINVDDEVVEPSTDELNLTSAPVDDPPYRPPTPKPLRTISKEGNMRKNGISGGSDSDRRQGSAGSAEKRIIQDGEATKRIESRFFSCDETPGVQSSDPVEQFSPERVDIKPRGYVKQQVARLDEMRTIDLRKIPKPVKNSMKPRNLVRANAIATSSGFTKSMQHKMHGPKRTTLALKACIFESQLFIHCKLTKEMTDELTLTTRDGAEVTKFKIGPQFTNAITTPWQNNGDIVIKLEEQSQYTGSGDIYFMFSKEPSSEGDYFLLIDLLKSAIKGHSTVHGKAAHTLWEEGEKSIASAKPRHRSQSESTNPRKRPASSMDTTPPPVLGIDISSSPVELKSPISFNLEGHEQGRSTYLRRSTRNRLPEKSKSPVVDLDEVILVYPQGLPGAVNITRGDLKRLEPGEFLNDTLIEFGLKLWLRELEGTNPELAKEVHVFSSFFYKKLSRKNLDDGYQSVRKWTSKFDLFAKKYIIVPINEHLHWYLAIIYQPEHILLSPPPSASPLTRQRQQLRPLSNPKPTRKPPDPPIRKKEPELMVVDDSEPERCKEDDLLELPIVSITVTTEDGLEIKVPDGASDCEFTDREELRPNSPRSVTTSEMDVDEQLQGRAQTPSPAVFKKLGQDKSISEQCLTSLCEADMETVSSSTQDDDDVNLKPESDISLASGIPPTTFYGKRGSTGKLSSDNVSRSLADLSIVMDEAEEQKNTASGQPRTYIFSLDSLGSKHPGALKHLNKYLKLEAKDKKKLEVTSEATCRSASVPGQPNFCDCGIYLLHFAQTFMSNPAQYCASICSSKATKKGATSEQLEEWNASSIAGIRGQLTDKILELSAEWKNGRDVKNNTSESKAETTVESFSDDDIDIQFIEKVSAKGKGKALASPKQGRAARIR